VWVDAQVGQVGMEVQRCQVLPLYHYILGTTATGILGID